MPFGSRAWVSVKPICTCGTVAGCTETMIQGCSNVGSLDAGVNLPLVLVESLRNRLESAGTFAEFLAGYKSDLSEMIAEVTGIVSEHQERRGRFGPQPVRSLLVDDCIDAGGRVQRRRCSVQLERDQHRGTCERE